MSWALVRAALRLSPRQLAFHVKRKIRNEGARRLPGLYASYVGHVARRTPAVTLDAMRRDDVHATVQSVVRYYYDEYVAGIDGAAQGSFTFFGQRADFGSAADVDWHHTVAAETDFHLWRMKLGHMGFVCPMLIDGDEKHLRAVHDLIEGYRARASFGIADCFSSYWFPYSVSHRILAVLSGYVQAIHRRDLPDSLRSEIESFLRWNVGFLLVNVEHELRNNHVERNLAALCLYFSCVDSVPGPIARRLDREVRRVIDACVLSDGFIVERSAMYQGLAVMALQVFANASFLSSKTRELADRMLGRAASAWLTMTHPDGEIALFNDSWFGEVPPARRVVAAGVEPAAVLPVAGYARLESETLFAILDGGPIGPRWNPGHGHADFLSLEVDVANHRFLVDPGTYQYSTGTRRAFERSAQSHNGPSRVGYEPVEYSGCFRVGRMSSARLEEVETTASGGRVRAEHTLRGAVSVARSVELADDMLSVTDTWQGVTDTSALVRLTVPAVWTLVEAGPTVLTFTLGEARADVRVVEGSLASVDSGDWACRYLESEGATIIVLRPNVLGCKSRLTWEVRAIGTSADFGSESRQSREMGAP